ncbi:MAG: AtpZ/AtpI family protein [Bauldia sp.]|nr:AtpZ/AtpI family protein [Bauldia sp.]
MSDPGAGDGGQEQKPATGDDEARLNARLGALNEELESRRGEVAAQSATVAAPTGRAGQGMALRLATEFVAGILVGGAIGWFFDGWLGTSPWGLIVFLLAGFAAGVLNALRTAGVVAESPARSRLEGKK